jgi:hypothetical protein
VLPEGVVRLPVTLDERVPEEQVTRHLRVDTSVLHLALGHDRYAVERDPLEGHDRAALVLPVRLRVGPFEQVPTDLLDLLRLDPRDLASEQP